MHIIVVQSGWTAIIWASYHGHLLVVQCLVEGGAEIHIHDKVRNNHMYCFA